MLFILEQARNSSQQSINQLRRERAWEEKERDSVREERRESLPKMVLERLRGARVNGSERDCLECFTENDAVKQSLED